MKPVTALPFTLQADSPQENQYWHNADIRSEGRGVARCSFHNAQEQGKRNAAYLVHAANAYPQLVKLLNEWRAEPDSTRADAILLAGSTALLRELGEIS